MTANMYIRSDEYKPYLSKIHVTNTGTTKIQNTPPKLGSQHIGSEATKTDV